MRKSPELSRLLSRNGADFQRVSRSIIELRIPVLAATFRCGVEQGPERIEIGRAARILSGIGGHATHFAAPEMPDYPIAAREHVVARHIGICRADIVARVIARHIRMDLVPRPAARLLCLDQSCSRRARNEYERHACSTSGSFSSQLPMNDVHIGHSVSRCGPNM